MSYLPHTWIELDFNALANNIATYKKIIGSRILAPVIKSNAYGHGMLEIGSFCNQNPDVDWLCVALLSDALRLRMHGIQKPILVLSTIDTDPIEAVGQNIRFSVSDYYTACMLNNAAQTKNAVLPIHIKIDTGLARLGISPHGAYELINKIHSLGNIEIEGIYTHCAESQKEDQTYTLQQIDIFHELIEALYRQGLTFKFIHAANSAATGALDLPWCNIFRIGAGIYGLWPSPANKLLSLQRHPDMQLQPILQWKSRIIHIKKLDVNQSIGYDRTFLTTRPTTVAIIPTGYYDGYDFRLANSGKVMIRSCYAPILGRVSMNMTTLDITDIPEAQIGDEVLLMGNFPQITPSDIAAIIGHPNTREILTKINPTIKRIPSVTQSVQPWDTSTLNTVHTYVQKSLIT